MSRIAITMLVCFICCASIYAQEVWSLQKCLQYAKENNIQLKQSEITIENAELSQKQNKQARYPSLSGSGSYSYNLGRSIDPTTNEFISRNSHLNRVSMSTGVQLYAGLTIRNSIKQSQYDQMAAEADRDRLENDLGLNISLAYLNVLLAQDQVEIAKNRRVQTKRQLDQTNTLIKAGSLPMSNKYTIEAQIAMDDQSIIAAENGLDIAYVSLKNQLDLASDYDMIIERPEINLPDAEYMNSLTVESLYQEALGAQPQIKANEYRKMSAETGVDIAKGRLQPSLSAFGQVGSNYSNSARKIDGYQTVVIDNTVYINNVETTIGFENEVPILADNYPYFDQLNTNLTQSYGLSLNVPIYNNGVNRVAIERAKLNVINTELTDELTRRQLRSDIQRALADARAAAKELEAAKKSEAAQQISYEMTEKRYNVGASTTFEFTNAKDNLDIAKANVVGARYTFLFRLKVLDFYQGKTITLN